MEGWFVHGGKVFIGRPAIGKDNERGLRLPSLKSFEECNLIINRVSWVPISKHDLLHRIGVGCLGDNGTCCLYTNQGLLSKNGKFLTKNS